jgi:DegV family protein with EDD domain
MGDYIILTDSSCDLPLDMVNKMEIVVLQLDVVYGNSETVSNDKVDASDFYRRLSKGEEIKTSAVNMEQASQVIEELFKQGKDILYLGFSSALSSTYQNVCMAAKEVNEAYPGRLFVAVDTLAASMGQGLLVYKAYLRKEEGLGIKENAAYIESIKLKLCHWFTVDDLMFLKRGGRISGVTARVGTMLDIKPILHVSDEGKLVNVGKVRGRKSSISELTRKMEHLAIDPENQDVFISHGDSVHDAEKLADIIRDKFGTKKITTSYVGPVIGAHSGPGTLALFFIGNNR